MSVPLTPPTSANPWKATHIVPLVGDVKRASIQNMAEYRRLMDSQVTAPTISVKVQSNGRSQPQKPEIINIEAGDETTTKEPTHLQHNKRKPSVARNKKAGKKTIASVPTVIIQNRFDCLGNEQDKENVVRNSDYSTKETNSKVKGSSTLKRSRRLANKKAAANSGNSTKANVNQSSTESFSEETVTVNNDTQLHKTYSPDLSMIAEEEDNEASYNSDLEMPSDEEQAARYDSTGKQGESDGIEETSMDHVSASIGEEIDVVTESDGDDRVQSGPLGNTFLGIGEIINILSGPHTILKEVPLTSKDGNYYVVDNENNIERRKKGQKTEFWDNCGSWTNGSSPTFLFTIQNNKPITVHNRKDKGYSLEITKNGKKDYKPLDPQPCQEDLLVVKRLYNTLSASEKGQDQFKRRCTWIINAPSSMPQISTNVAVIEYIGRFPGRQPHGNSTKNQEAYRRTKPSVMNDLKEQLKTSVGTKGVRLAMNRKTRDDYLKHRDDQQLRNMKHNLNKISNPTPSNAADQIVHVEEMVKTHPLVHSVTHLTDIDAPVITLASPQQITDIRRFCGTGRTVLGVDKTYNLGDFHVTPTVFKDLSVKRKTSGEHPITFGPTFIHTNSSAMTYGSFFYNIARNLSEEECNKLVIGSDEELAFKVSIRRWFPRATHILCTRHLSQNTDKYLEDEVGYRQADRMAIKQAIYGEDGLNYANDIDTFNYRLERLRETITTFDTHVRKKTFMPYFENKLLPMLRTHVIEPTNAGLIERGWTNNNCESGNHILKSTAQWKKKDILKFIEDFYGIVEGEQLERCRAIRGMGDYKLDDRYIHNRVDLDRWSNMSEDSKDNRERKFLMDKGRSHPNIVTSTDGQRTVYTTPDAGKKLNQTRRKRAERSRSRTPSAKRKLLDC